MIQKFIDTEGNEQAGTKAIKEYFGSDQAKPLEALELFGMRVQGEVKPILEGKANLKTGEGEEG